MSFGVSRGKKLDTTGVALDARAFPPLLDDAVANPAGARLDIRSWFSDPSRPLHLEIGSGKGTFLVQEMPNIPGANFIGIEYEFEFFNYAADRLRRAGFDNVKMLCTDAGEFVHWRVPDRSVRVLHLYFPDPWPKRKHHRRRMVSDRFLQDCTRVLEIGGEVRIATDHPDYWTWMEEHFARWTGDLRPFTRAVFVKPASAREGELVGTNFERKYREEVAARAAPGGPLMLPPPKSERVFNAAVLRLERPDSRCVKP